MEVYGAILQSSKRHLRSYLERRGGGGGAKAKDDSFSRVASQFPGDCGKSVDGGQGSGVIHILTLLLRLRQSCCHPALLRTVNTGTL
ncbi:transcription termination factor 2-like [Lampetra fluviatilis]